MDLVRGDAIKNILFSTLIILTSSTATANWVLTNDQRRQYLHAYSPIIIKAAAENKNGYEGYDWITNFYFDQDQNFANNKVNWFNIVKKIQNGYQVRPTLYTYILELTENQSKSLILQYHVYHAADEDSIHDWERVEVRLDNVSPTPLTQETVQYVVATEHSDHNARAGNQIQYLTTAYGRHPLIYQASWKDKSLGLGSLRKNELRFVDSSIENLLQPKRQAIVDIKGVTKAAYHYMFVDGWDSEAVKKISATAITAENAGRLYSGADRDQFISTDQIRNITFELQDLADIMTTHWVNPQQSKEPNPSWTLDFPILLDETPIKDEDSNILIPIAHQLYGFRTEALNDIRSDKAREGYPSKSWFWGAYDINGKSHVEESINDDERIQANSYPEKLIYNGKAVRYYQQHDYLMHTLENPKGSWLTKGWQQESLGGFDGRWVQLFKD